MAAKFIGYTIVLMARNRNSNKLPEIVKVEFSRTIVGSVKLQAVSGRNLAQIPYATVTISADEWDASANRRFNNVESAEWALDKVGFDICK